MARKRRKNGIDPAELAKGKRRTASLGTALARNTKKALKSHGNVWLGRMDRQFSAPLTQFGQPNTNTKLHNRKNFLRNSMRQKVEGTKLKDLGLTMKSDSPYARIQELGGTIRARGGGYLAIPIDDNLTPAGVPRWESPLNPEIVDGFFLEGKRTGALYYVRQTRGKNKKSQTEFENLEFLFLLKKEVNIPGPGPHAKKRMKSRLGMVENAFGARARKTLRKRLVRALRDSVAQASGGTGKVQSE